LCDSSVNHTIPDSSDVNLTWDDNEQGDMTPSTRAGVTGWGWGRGWGGKCRPKSRSVEV